MKVLWCQGVVQRGAQCKIVETMGRGCQVTNFARDFFSFFDFLLTFSHRDPREQCQDDADTAARDSRFMCATFPHSTFHSHFPPSFVSLSLCRM